MRFAIFVILMPLAGYLFLRFGPIWGAATAAYLYFAIPGKEFYAPELPYQAGFWGLAVLTAFRFRSQNLQDAKAEILRIGRGVATDVFVKARPEMEAALVAGALERESIDASALERGVVHAVEQRSGDAVDDLAPPTLAVPLKSAVLEVLERAARTGAEETRKLAELGGMRSRGDLKAAMVERAFPAMAAEVERGVADRVTARLTEAVDRHDRDRDPRRIKPSDGPLDLPLFRGPLYGAFTNTGLWLHFGFIALTWLGAQRAEYSHWSAMAKFEVTYLLLIPMIAIICAVRAPEHFRIFVYAWLLGVLHLSYNAVTLWLRQGGGRADRIGGQGGEANFYGSICVTVAPVIFSIILTERRRLFRFLALGASPWAALGIIACGSRGALIAFLSGMGYWMVQTRKKGIAIGLGMVAAAGFLAVAPDSFWDRMGTIVGPKETNQWVKAPLEPSAASRIVLWNLALEVYKEHPWLGVGPHQYVNVSAERTTLTDAYFGQRGMMTHNTWLQMLAEYGTIGTLVWGGNFFLAALFFRRARKKLAPYRRWDWYAGICLGLEAGVLANAISQTFSSFQWYDYTYWSMVFGPLSYQIATEIAQREEWMRPGGHVEAAPPPRYGPPKKDALDLEIDLAGTPRLEA